MAKTPENIEYYLDPKNDKDYLQDLLVDIKMAQASQEPLIFRIVEPKEKGFLVKVGGLFGFVPYPHFCWNYPNIESWKNISPLLIGRYFKGRIYLLEEDPILILINAKGQGHEKPTLEKYSPYKGVVVQKRKYGLFVDLGIHFNWLQGSITGLIHKSTFPSRSDFESFAVGDIIYTNYNGTHENGHMILGTYRDGEEKWHNGEMEQYVGTIQKTVVVRNELDHTEFYVLGVHKGSAPALKEFYPNFRKAARNHIFGIKHGEIIDCEIIRINKRRDSFILKLPLEPPLP